MGSHGSMPFLPFPLNFKGRRHMQFQGHRLTVLLWESLQNSFLVKSLICVYSGTVAGAREAFLHGVPAVAVSYHWIGGRSSIDDLKRAAECCLPLLNALLAEISSGTYPEGAFLNVDLPTDLTCHKGFKITRQGKSMTRIGWKQTTACSPVGKSYVTADMEINSLEEKPNELSISSPAALWFKRRIVEKNGYTEEEGEDIDFKALQEGYITVTPLGALSCIELEAQNYFKDWLLHVTCLPSPSSL
uniref:5'-nucleotidase surE n=1 Tax=Anthurium amnicola TaxID=1678845 RepID=A0A1D1YQ12_9ARAE